jgi:tetratricopeptide (TPR) repeat protein/tRNA A-37 threonylcarbamoyl transferase component Bud32
MAKSLACPDARDLERLAQGRLSESEAEELGRHVLGCSACAALLNELQAADPLIPDLQAALGQPPLESPLVDGLVEQLVGSPPDSTVKVAPSASITEVGAAGAVAAPVPALPGYEILEVLGRGGMGVVYKARQRALDRLVALKMILTNSAADAEERTRFRREAEAVAHLEHPHIVHIYEVGDQAGQPYCALEYVSGGTLARKLAGVPLPGGEAAGIVATLARTMHWAHQRGVVHRDLKPANVLLTADGVLKIADFGLAKRLEGAASLTHTGYVVGTPSYMAPEQAAGKNREVGPAADVYALGAILYETLTGRPPFLGAAPLDVLAQVVNAEPVPPRRWQPRVPVDLDTICLKCLEKEAGKRYASAGDLADDLERFQKGEPIRARPVGVAGRLWRWARRNRRVAGLLAALVVVVVGSLAGLTWLWARAEHQRQRAEANFEAAFGAVDDYLTAVSENRLLNEPGLQPLRKELLLKAQAYYEKFVREQGTDPAVRAALARAYRRLAAIHHSLGDLPRAKAFGDKAVAVLGELVQDDPREVHHRIELAAVHNLLGNVYLALNQTGAAEAAYRQAIALLRDQSAQDAPTAAALKEELAVAHNDLGKTYLDLTGQGEKAVAAFEEALTLSNQLVRADADNPELKRLQGITLHNLHRSYAKVGRKADAVKAGARALQIREQLARRHPAVLQYQVDLSYTYDALGVRYGDAGQPDTAARFYRKAIDLLNKLHQENPAVTEFQVQLASCYRNLGTLHLDFDQFAKAEGAFGEALRLLKKLAGLYPHVPRFSELWGDAQHNMALLYWRSGRAARAKAGFESLLPLRARLAAAHPAVPDYQASLARVYTNLGSLYKEKGKTDQAETAFRKAQAILEKLAHDHPANAEYRSTLASNLNDLGLLYRQMGQARRAEAAYRQAVALHRALARENPRSTVYRVRLARHWHNLAQVCADTGRLEETRAAYREALGIRQELVNNHPDVPTFQDNLAATHNGLGIWHLDHGQYPQAEEAFRKCLALRLQMKGAQARVPAFRQNLGHTYYNLGLVQQRTGRRSLAEASYRQAESIQEKLAQAYPGVPEYQKDLARTCSRRAELAPDPYQADTIYRKALTIKEKLVKDNPTVPTYQGELAEYHYNRGVEYQQAGRKAEAEGAYRKAFPLYEKLVREYPAAVSYRAALAKSYGNCGILLQEAGKNAEAEALHQKALTIREKLVHDSPRVAEHQEELARSYSNLALLAQDTGQKERAETFRKKEKSVRENLAREHPAVAAYRNDLAWSCNDLGNLYWDRGQKAQAVAEYRQGMDQLETLHREHPRMPDYAVNLGCLGRNLGSALLGLGQDQEALTCLERTVAVLERVLRQDPKQADARLYLRNAFWDRANHFQQKRRFAEALKDWDRALERDDGQERAALRRGRALALACLGEHARATAEATELARAKDLPPQTCLELARVLARSAAAVAKDARLPAAEREALARSHGTRAVQLLTRATDYLRNPEQRRQLQTDAELDPLRSRKDFRQWLRGLNKAPTPTGKP